jgi:glyoxylase-like metal-dependent hydrolase (beta-lactamase superfamily II)
MEAHLALPVFPVEKLTPLENIKSIDLGDRTLTIIHVPGHTAGSVCLMDEKTKFLFAGDSINLMTWLSLPESTSLPVYRDALLHLQTEAVGIQKIYSGHMGPLVENFKGIQKRITCVNLILAGKKKGRPANLGLTEGLLAFSGGTMLLYKNNQPTPPQSGRGMVVL